MAPLFRASAQLAGETGEQVLQWAIESGRLYLRGDGATPLSLGEPCHLDLGWTIGPDGSQRFGVRGDDRHLQVFVLDRIWCCDADAAEIRPVSSSLSPSDALRLLRAPPVPPTHTIEISQALSGLPGMGARLPLPQGLPSEAERVAPSFVARVAMKPMPDPTAPSYMPGARIDRAVVEVFAEYRGQRAPLARSRGRVHGYHEGHLQAYERDSAAERQLADAIDAAFAEQRNDTDAPTGASHIWLLSDEPGGYIEPIAASIERLRDVLDRFDARIEFETGFPFELLPNPSAIEIEVDDGNDWFATSLGIEVDGERVDLVPFLVSAVESINARGGTLPDGDFRLFLRLDARRVIGVPGERLRPLLQVLLQWGSPRQRVNDEGRLLLRRFEAAALANTGQQGDWRVSSATREFAERLAGFRGLPEVAIPSTLRAELRDYQHHGLSWLQFLRSFGFGGVLADDMGLGKTVQLLAHLLVEQAEGRTDLPSLVVAPTSVIFNWQAEAARFAPTLRVLLLHGPQRSEDFARIAEHDLVLTSYALLARDEAVLQAQPWHLVVLDEAQAIKNAQARCSRIVRRLHARQRLALTGTPVENHLGELWSQFDFLMPGLLGDERSFRRDIRTPIEKHADRDRQIALNRRIAPFLLRRTKDAVVRELPPKTEVVRSVELEGPQRDLYETLRAAMEARVRAALAERGFANSRIEILDALLKLRQACCDPRLVKLGTPKVRSSAKLDELLEMLEALLDEGRRVLVFSQFTSMLDLIEVELEKRDWKWVRLSGESTNRGALVERFQSGAVPLFLLSLKAGGVGLNLTAADTVIHYDPWWNPAAEDQATDRAYRIGQDKPVFVYRLIAQGTVEERMVEMQARKRGLASALYDETGGASAAFDAEDLARLFAPM
jgi:superfamily II DNA or RNA helicase